MFTLIATFADGRVAIIERYLSREAGEAKIARHAASVTKWGPCNLGPCTLSIR